MTCAKIVTHTTQSKATKNQQNRKIFAQNINQKFDLKLDVNYNIIVLASAIFCSLKQNFWRSKFLQNLHLDFENQT